MVLRMFARVDENCAGNRALSILEEIARKNSRNMVG